MPEGPAWLPPPFRRPAERRPGPHQPVEAAARPHIWQLQNLWPATTRGAPPASSGHYSNQPSSSSSSTNGGHDSSAVSGSSSDDTAAAAGIAVSAAAAAPGAPQQPLQLQRARLQDLGWRERFVAAAGASVVSAVIVNPLDVVKTRMQAQAAVPDALRRAVPEMTLAERWAITSWPTYACPNAQPGAHRAAAAANCAAGAASQTASAATRVQPYGSTLDGVRTIVRQEGVMALWRGTSASLLMAVPMVGIYFPLYDALTAHLEASSPRVAPYAPLLAGSAARTVAVLCTSPLELIRTRMQGTVPAAVTEGGTAAKAASMWRHLPSGPDQRVSTRVRTMWTGVGATLARDVPFSAIYWQLLEPTRRALLPTAADGAVSSHSRVIGANLVAGSVAGAVAAAATTPLDVVKTRAQLVGVIEGLEANPQTASGIVHSLRVIAQEGGVSALFAGVGPRALRAAPACAVVVASYEALKLLYT